MHSKLPSHRRPSWLLFYALTVVALSGCYGDSEFGFIDQSTADVDPVAGEQSAVANDETFGDEYWAEQALGFDEFVPEPGLGALIDEDDWINTGRWGDLIEWPEIAVGAANMTDGRIVTWASYVDDFFGANTELTTASIFNPDTGVFEDAEYSGHNMFCAGVSMLADGRVFIAGGGTHVSTVSVFEDNQFREIDSMAMARWYPTSTTLPSGQVLTSLGTTASGNSELWTQGYGWQLLDNVALNSAYDFPYSYSDWYPALNVSPDGSLFHPGPNNELFSINLDQDDAYTAHGPREVNGNDRLYNTTVIYDEGKMLVAGGGNRDSKNTALTIDLNGAAPVVEPTEPMHNARAMQNSVVLPNGEVLVIGGNTSGIQFSDEGSILTPEIWNPDTGEWREAAPHKKPRNYHSTALLLQDGRVISMGGGMCGECKSNHQNGEIYEPPYLFDGIGNKAARPSINGGAAAAKAGDAITLIGSNDIVEFNMIRLAAVTHHHTTDQRLVPAPFNKVGAGNYELQLNSNSNVLIPGYYWIFGLNAQGVPSEGHQIEVQVTTDPVETPATTDTNVNYALYEGFWTALPDFSTLTPVATGTQANFSLNNRERNWGYGFVFTSTINVPADGIYTFYLASDDGSRLSIDGNVVVNHDGNHQFEAQKNGSTFLTAGQHDIKVEYYEGNANDGLLVSWSSDAMSKRPVTRFDLGSEVVIVPEPTTPTTPITPLVLPKQPLVNYSYYEGNWNNLPAFDLLTPVKTGSIENYSLIPRERDEFYAFRFDSRITVDTAGAYTFYTSSDDGSRLYVDGQLVVDNDGLHAMKEQNGVVTLAAGEHDVRVEYFEKTGQDALVVSWAGPGFGKQVISNTAFKELTEPTITDTAPVAYSYYEGNWNNLPDFDSLQAVKTGSLDNFSLAPREQDGLYGFRFDSKIVAQVDGAYTFYLNSDDGSRLYVDGQLLVDHDGLHQANQTKAGMTTLAAGEHDIRVEFFEKTGQDDLIVSWKGPGFDQEVIPDSAFAGADGATTTTGGTSTGGYSVAASWDYDLYYGFWTALPDFDALTPVVTSVTPVIDLSVSPVNTEFAVRFRGTIDVSQAGRYKFYTKSDDGSLLFVDGQLVVDNDGLHAPIEKQGQVTLAAGTHDIEIRYLQGYGGSSFSTAWAGPGFTKTLLVPGDSSTDSGSVGQTGGQSVVPDGLSARLTYQYFEGAWTNLPDFSALQPVAEGIVNNFNLSVGGAVNQYGLQYAGQLAIETAGEYTFYVRSNDGTKLSIADQLIVDNDGRHGAIEKQGSVSLVAGVHPIELSYFQNGGSEALEVFWSGPGFDKELIPDSVLYQP